MNLQNNSTKLKKDLQEVIDRWDNKILSYLPQNLDELAEKTGVIRRKRGFNSTADLLKILFLYAFSNISFRILLLVFLEFPIFLILHGENNFLNLLLFFMKFYISYYHLLFLLSQIHPF